MLSQLRSGAIEFFTLSPLILSTLVPVASINGIGFAWSGYDKVWPAMDGELGDAGAGPDPEGRPLRLPEEYDNGFRQITSSTKPIKTPGRPEGLQDPRPAEPALDLDVQGLRRRADVDQLLRDLFGAADQGREGQENPLVHHPDGQALRGPEVPLEDQPHVGRLLVPRQRQGLERAAEGRAAGHREERQRRRGAPARGHLQAQHLAREGALREGARLQHRRHQGLPGEAADGRVLQGVAPNTAKRPGSSWRSTSAAIS